MTPENLLLALSLAWLSLVIFFCVARGHHLDVDQWRTKLHCASFSVACLARRSIAPRRKGHRTFLAATSLANGAGRRSISGAANTILLIGWDRSTRSQAPRVTAFWNTIASH
jgi:hypothetical protein